MDKTPVGKHEIRKISGEAEIIDRRGREIESLGIQMKEAAGVLEIIKDGAETRGKSLDEIKEKVGDKTSNGTGSGSSTSSGAGAPSRVTRSTTSSGSGSSSGTHRGES